MEVCGERSIRIEDKSYWTVAQFSRLTKRKEEYIRHLISVGNRIRKLKAARYSGSLFICCEELFDFPFVMNGRPSPLGICVKKYILEGDALNVVEESFEK